MKINAISSYSVLHGNKIYGQREFSQTQANNSNKQIKELTNLYYPVSFKRTKEEHESWGAKIDPITKEASFKIYTYPDTKSVTVNVQKAKNGEIAKYELVNKGNGIFETEKKIKKGKVEPGDSYYYTIEPAYGKSKNVKDPYSFRQKFLNGASVVYDHSQYKWNDDRWYRASNTQRISRKANEYNGLTPVEGARIYEVNIATLTQGGTFEAAKEFIKDLPSKGFNAVEIMPVENTNSYNWGYDGVDKFAPSEHLGGADGLKSFVDYAHSIGLNVIMDMVPNHIGHDGNNLKEAGPYIDPYQDSAFGESFNYEPKNEKDGKNYKYVRDYVVNAALNWLNNYHCDGLRLDMTQCMWSDFTMKEIAAEINYHNPDAFLIAEDGRMNVKVYENGTYGTNYDVIRDERILNPLEDWESGEGKPEAVHCQAIANISNNNADLARVGFDSEWDFNFYHTLSGMIYDNIHLDNYEKACNAAQKTVKYVMSHDEIGNYEGTRLIAKLMTPYLKLNEKIKLNDEDIQRAKSMSDLKNISSDEARRIVQIQKAQLVSEKLATMYQTGELDKYKYQNNSFMNEVLSPLGISKYSFLCVKDIENAFEHAIKKSKLAYVNVYSIPGPKMVFQGDEKADLTPFRFFRKLSYEYPEEKLHTEKGYDTGEKGYKESKLGGINYSENGKKTMAEFSNLVEDLNNIVSENPALQNGRIVTDSTIKHTGSDLIAIHTKKGNNEIYTISNFKNADYPVYRWDIDKYGIDFPPGKWEEILNTDDAKYGGSNNFLNNEIIYGNGYEQPKIRIAGNSAIMFRKI